MVASFLPLILSSKLVFCEKDLIFKIDATTVIAKWFGIVPNTSFGSAKKADTGIVGPR